MANSSYILSIDQGTTSSRAVLFKVNGLNSFQQVASESHPFKQYYPQSSWVEHDLEEIWNTVILSIKGALQKAKVLDADFTEKKITSVGITNQRETLAIFDSQTSSPAHRAIVWQCKRSTEICSKINQNSQTHNILKNKTGLLADPYFTASKLAWICQNKPEIANGLASGKYLWGTIDTYLLHRLTQGQSYATDHSNASRTLFYNLHTQSWDDSLFQIWDLQPSILPKPQLQDSASIYGEIRGIDFLPKGLKVQAMIGDQQSALAGQGCFSPNQAKCTFGTGAFLLNNTGSQPIISKNGLLTTVAWSLNGSTTYALEGATFIAGAAVQFLRDNLEIISNADQMNLTKQERINFPAAPELYFIPSLSGLGAPWWQANATGVLIGLNRGTQKKNILLACLEGIALQVDDLLDCMNHDLKTYNKNQIGNFKTGIELLRVDGGAAQNDTLLQIQADLSLNSPQNLIIERPPYIETTALGAGLFAALGNKTFSSLEEIQKLFTQNKKYFPDKKQINWAAQTKKQWTNQVSSLVENIWKKNQSLEDNISPQKEISCV